MVEFQHNNYIYASTQKYPFFLDMSCLFHNEFQASSEGIKGRKYYEIYYIDKVSTKRSKISYLQVSKEYKTLLQLLMNSILSLKPNDKIYLNSIDI